MKKLYFIEEYFLTIIPFPFEKELADGYIEVSEEHFDKISKAWKAWEEAEKLLRKLTEEGSCLKD